MLSGVSFYAAWPTPFIKRTVRNHSLSKQQLQLSPGYRKNEVFLQTNLETCISNRTDLQNLCIGNLPIWFSFIKFVHPVTKCHFNFHVYLFMLLHQKHVLTGNPVILAHCEVRIFHSINWDMDPGIQKLRWMQLFEKFSVFLCLRNSSASANHMKRNQVCKFM